MDRKGRNLAAAHVAEHHLLTLKQPSVSGTSKLQVPG